MTPNRPIEPEKCHGCQRESDQLEPQGESGMAQLCPACVLQALREAVERARERMCNQHNSAHCLRILHEETADLMGDGEQ